MATLSDFSGVLQLAAPDATAANNVAGKLITVGTSHYISLGPVALGGTTAQNDIIGAIPLFAFSPKVIVGAAKTAGATWTAGQTLYLIAATNIYTTASTGNLIAGVAVRAAASGDTTGDVLPCAPGA